MQAFFVYCLATVEIPTQTYIGATTDVNRRLGQHNAGRKAGGAKRTAARPEGWYRICYVSGFDTWNNALSFEWHWKHFTRKIKDIYDPLERRKKALETCLNWAKEVKGLELEIVYE
jgi:predicted GIY-YIG superfamily endonuclease